MGAQLAWTGLYRTTEFLKPYNERKAAYGSLDRMLSKDAMILMTKEGCNFGKTIVDFCHQNIFQSSLFILILQQISGDYEDLLGIRL